MQRVGHLTKVVYLYLQVSKIGIVIHRSLNLTHRLNKADSRSNHKLRPSYQSHPNIISTFSNSTMLYLVIMLFVLIYPNNFYFQCFLRFIVLLLTFLAGFQTLGRYSITILQKIYMLMLKIFQIQAFSQKKIYFFRPLLT